MRETWPYHRLWNEKLITLREAEDGTYSINDLVEANEARDAWHEARRLANETEKR